MAWRHGEIWLDTELLWFRERWEAQSAALALHAPALVGLGSVALPAGGVANGLAASRLRRAEQRRRRRARRTRAAALVIAPAAILTLAGQRLGGGAGAALREDPISQTVRRSTAETSAAQPATTRARSARGNARWGGERNTNILSSRAQFPRIDWHRATSRGLPYSGSLSGGTQLPIEGPDLVTWNPIEDSAPNRPRRLYGHESTIRRTLSVIAAYRSANPGAPRVVVGDLSLRGGGPMDAHRSHQNGLDVDVYYPRLDRALRAPRTTGQIDRRLVQDLVDRFVAAGAQMIFVGHSAGVHGPGDVVIPYPNHENHMHVRFPPPSN